MLVILAPSSKLSAEFAGYLKNGPFAPLEESILETRTQIANSQHLLLDK